MVVVLVVRGGGDKNSSKALVTVKIISYYNEQINNFYLIPFKSFVIETFKWVKNTVQYFLKWQDLSLTSVLRSLTEGMCWLWVSADHCDWGLCKIKETWLHNVHIHVTSWIAFKEIALIIKGKLKTDCLLKL